MSDEERAPIEVSRRIAAPAAKIFDVISNPRMHLEIDGSGMLRGAATDEPVAGVGDVFVMNMYFHAHGDYQMDNYIVEFEQNKRITWEPQAGKGHAEVGGRVGHRWGFQLTPDGDDATIVTETYDCSRAPRDFRESMDNGRMWISGMEDTLKRLDDIVTKV